MFHFPGCPPVRLWIHLTVTGHYPGRVPPFGYPRINAHLQLPAAFRSLSRPSSAISALASTLRSYSLDLASTVSAFLRLLRRVHNLLISFVSSLCSFQGARGLCPLPFAAAISDLSLRPSNGLVQKMGFVLLYRSWWAEVDSNHRPLAYQASALTG